MRPLSDADERLLRRLLDASASLWTELNYERQQNYFKGKSVWDTDDYRRRYVDVTGSPTAQQLIRKNGAAWESFFSLMATYEDPEDDEVTERPFGHSARSRPRLLRPAGYFVSRPITRNTGGYGPISPVLRSRATMTSWTKPPGSGGWSARPKNLSPRFAA